MTKRLFIIDALAMAFRTFYGVGRAGLSTAQGKPISAVFGSALFLNKLIRDEKPDYLVAVVDSPLPNFRHRMFPEYKQNRDKMPDDLKAQMPDFWRLLRSFGIPLVEEDGVEADDLIGSIVSQHSSPSCETYIVSGDKDFLQLVTESSFLYSPKKNQPPILVDIAGVRERFSCEPHQVVDCLALIGDKADHIPGVKGIGEKGAAKLIAEYGTLEGIYDHLHQLKGKLKEHLENDRANAFLSRDLVRLKLDHDLPPLESWSFSMEDSLNSPQLISLYDEFEFRSLLESSLSSSSPSIAKPLTSTDHPLSSQILNDQNLEPFLRSADHIGDIGIQVIADGADIMTSRAIELHLSHTVGKIVVYQNEGAAINGLLKTFLEHPARVMVGHDLKFQLHILHNTGVVPKGTLKDTMVMDHLLDSNHQLHNMSALKDRFLGEKGPSPLGHHAELALRLSKVLGSKLAGYGLKRVFEEIEMPLLRVLVSMEREGMFLDRSYLLQYSGMLEDRKEQLQAEIFAAAGREFNIQSTKQLQAVLFEELKIHEKLGIKRLKKTKTGYSTDETVLSKLMAHPIAKSLLNYREAAKLKSTYVDALPEFIHPVTGRIHGSFHQAVTATGRLSSDRPNLQNIPMRSKLGKEIRKAFKSQYENGLLISADYSQIEIRLLAAFAGSRHLIQCFQDGLDIHAATAARIFGLSVDQVDRDTRNRAKAVNFGIIYGMGPSRLASETGVSMKEAKDFIERYFENFPEIKVYLERLKNDAIERGFSQTVTGRRRPISGIQDANKAVAARWQNIAVNSPIQGSAADLIKLAMIDIHRRIMDEGLRGRMLLQVHDELVFECPQEEKEPLSQLVKQSMESAMTLACPLLVDIGWGSNWLEAH